MKTYRDRKMAGMQIEGRKHEKDKNCVEHLKELQKSVDLVYNREFDLQNNEFETYDY
jgi:hypothetical protein